MVMVLFRKKLSLCFFYFILAKKIPFFLCCKHFYKISIFTLLTFIFLWRVHWLLITSISLLCWHVLILHMTKLHFISVFTCELLFCLILWQFSLICLTIDLFVFFRDLLKRWNSDSLTNDVHLVRLWNLILKRDLKGTFCVPTEAKSDTTWIKTILPLAWLHAQWIHAVRTPNTRGGCWWTFLLRAGKRS